MPSSYKIKELWVYPVKGCQGVQVQEWPVTKAGFELDRAFCIVDASGQRYPANEVLSPRSVPAILKLETSLENRILHLSAPGMEQPLLLDLDQPCTGERVTILCASKSAKWDLGELQGQFVSTAAGDWISKFLNAADDPRGRKPETRFELVRTDSHRDMRDYPATFPILDNCATDRRFQQSGARFHDFAPFLLTNTATLDFINEKLEMGQTSYPMNSFRSNIVITPANDQQDGLSKPSGVAAAWEEETFDEISVGELALVGIKACPRCTITLRTPQGDWIFPSNKRKLHKVLDAEFPHKAHDVEWGSWRSATFGMFVGFAELPQQGARLRVGDAVTVHSKKPLDHSSQSSPTKEAQPIGNLLSLLRKLTKRFSWKAVIILLAVIVAALLRKK